MTGRAVLITGITGRDGRYAARLLAAEGMRVVGTTPDLDGPAAKAMADAGIALGQWARIASQHIAVYEGRAPDGDELRA